MPDYSTLITAAGQAAFANAIAIQTPVIITAMAVGDSNGVGYDPDENQIALVNEVYESNAIDVTVEAGGIIAVEMTIPVDQGGWHVREAAVKADDGTVLAIMRYPDSYKPLPSSSIASTKSITMKLDVGNTNAVTWQIDPASKANIGGQLRPDFRSVESIEDDPPGNAILGQTWIVGLAPTGAWVGHENELAEWTGTAWAFAEPTPWMLVSASNRKNLRWAHDVAPPEWIEQDELDLFEVKVDTTKTIDPDPANEADFLTVAQAIAWLRNAWIYPGATVTMALSAGDHAAGGVVMDAPFLKNVVWVGAAPTGAMPDQAALAQKTAAQTETILRAWLPTRLILANADIKLRMSGNFKNVAVLDGTVHTRWTNLVDDGKRSLVAEFENCAIHGGNQYPTGGRSGFWANGAGVVVMAKNCVATHMGGAGFSGSDGGSVHLLGACVAMRNDDGLSASNGGVVDGTATGTTITARENGINVSANSGRIFAPGAGVGGAVGSHIVRVQNDSYVNLFGANIGFPTGAQPTTVRCEQGSHLDVRSATAGGSVVFSPALNTIGNQNSFISG